MTGLFAISRMNRRAMGLTAEPEYPETIRWPFTSAPRVTDLMVLMAEMPSAPAKWAARANWVIDATLGVILGMTGMLTDRLT